MNDFQLLENKVQLLKYSIEGMEVDIRDLDETVQQILRWIREQNLEF